MLKAIPENKRHLTQRHKAAKRLELTEDNEVNEEEFPKAEYPCFLRGSFFVSFVGFCGFSSSNHGRLDCPVCPPDFGSGCAGLSLCVLLKVIDRSCSTECALAGRAPRHGLRASPAPTNRNP